MNINNFYKDFDNIFNKFELNNSELYSEFIELYENYLFLNKTNNNLLKNLTIHNFLITEDGLLKNLHD